MNSDERINQETITWLNKKKFMTKDDFLQMAKEYYMSTFSAENYDEVKESN